MVEAVRLEKLVAKAIAGVGRSEWVPFSIAELRNRIGEFDAEARGTSVSELVEAVMALESNCLISIRKVQGSPAIVVPYDRTKSQEETYRNYYFCRGAFELRMTHEGRKTLNEIAASAADRAAPTEESDEQLAPDRYCFHTEIEKVGRKLYRDGHYNSAAFKAYIRVIEEVQARSGLQEDGDPLMNRAFGFDKQTPVIRFNRLQTEAEKDEQRGLMFLFKGMVGLRNAEAHSNRPFDDPYRAYEYLALASLLMRLLEIGLVNPKP
jgi:uncharacterized protein (TIGR02391 family)